MHEARFFTTTEVLNDRHLLESMNKEATVRELASPSDDAPLVDEITEVQMKEIKEASKRLSFSSVPKDDQNETKNRKLKAAQKKNDSLVDVYLRLRPKIDGSAGVETLTPSTSREVIARAPQGGHAYQMGERETKFTFSHVFQTKTLQTDIYDRVSRPLVKSVLMGKQALLFAYGMTNAGKTYTIQGTKSNPGVLPRALGEIFKAIEDVGPEDESVGTKVTVSYLEIYNEKIYDLLAPPPKNSWETRKPLSLKEIRGRVVVQGLRKKIVSETSEALSTAEEGLQNRAVAETVLNSDSSRSHSIFTIYIHGLKGSSKRPGRYSIVDLAGSERSDRTKATGSRAREANKINSSLMHLIHCIRQMRWNQTHSNSQRIVPFRETRLTRLFQESFVGSRAGKIAMVVNASTEAGDFDETLHVLKNASLARSVCITKKSKVNSWRSMASMQKYGLDGRRRKRAAEKSTEDLQADSNKLRKRSNDKVVVNNNGKGASKAAAPPAPSVAIPLPAIPDEDQINALAEKDTKISELNAEVSSLRDEIAAVETELRWEIAQEFEVRFNKAQEDFSERHERMVKSMEEKYKRKLSLARMSDIGNGRDSGAGYDEDEIECMDDQIAECEEEMTRMREQHASDISKLKEAHEVVLQESRRKIDQMENSLTSTKTSMADSGMLKTKLQLAMQDVLHKDKELKSAKTEIQSLESTIKRLHEAVKVSSSEAEEEIKSIVLEKENVIQSQKGKIDALENQVKFSTEHQQKMLDEEKKKNAQLASQLSQFQAKASEMQKVLEAARNEGESSSKLAQDKHEKEMESLMEEIETTTGEKEAFENKYQVCCMELKAAREEVEELQSSQKMAVDELSKQLTVAKNSKLEIEANHNSHLNSETRSLQNELEIQRQSVKALQSQLLEENENFIDTTKEKDTEIANYETKLKESQDMNVALEAELRASQDKNNHLTDRMKELTELRAFNDKHKKHDSENDKATPVPKKTPRRRKKLSDINPDSNILQTGDNETHKRETPAKSSSKKPKSNAKQFARTVKGSFRGFKSLLSRSATKASPSQPEAPIARRTRSSRRGSVVDRL